MPAEKHTGQCLCGAVKYQVTGKLQPVTACHCSQCRRTSGHFAAMTSAPRYALEISTSQSLRWFASSQAAERGFCVHCGSNLFWREMTGVEVSITAGTLDPPTGLAIARHIFVDDKADYYDITDAAQQFSQG
jgi:hypothetical protein